MDAATIEYIRSLKPASHADGRALVRKGMEIGRSFEAPLTWYEGYRNHMEFKKACQREGKIYWTLLMGLATMEDELAAVKKIYEFQERTGFKLGSLLHIPSGNVALPREYREHAPKTTSFVLDDLEDWLALRNAAPIDISLNDHHLVCPNSIETTVNALKAGAVRVGSFGQFLWDYPGFADDVKRYSDMVTSLGINPVSITEKIAVPTLQELLNIYACGKRVEEKAEEWMPLIDWTPILKMKDVMVAEARRYFENAMNAFRAAGIDTEDPLEMLLTLKKFAPQRLESAFHSSTVDGQNPEVIPFYPTVLGRQTGQMRDEIVRELEAAGMGGSLSGRKIVIASGDAHAYGLMLVDGVLRAMGAQTINIGVDMDPVDVLDAADEDGTPYVGVSCHNGQALDYGRQLLQLAEARGRDYVFFMGGKLNTILPGDAEPTEVGGMLCDMGIQADNDLRTTVALIARHGK